MDQIEITHGIGHNGGPALDEPDLLFIDKRIVAEAAAYLQFRFNGLDRLLDKRKSKLGIGFRRVLEYCLDGLVTQQRLAEVLGLHRDTVGDDQGTVERWTEKDDDAAAQIEFARQAIIGHVSIQPDLMVECIKRLMSATPRINAKDEARRLARRVSDEALAALEPVILLDVKNREQPDPRKHERKRRRALNEAGLAECFKLKLLIDAEPHLSRVPDPDRMVCQTPLGADVYLQALVLARISRPKREKRSVEDDEEGDE